jgi:hypothetical protein
MEFFKPHSIVYNYTARKKNKLLLGECGMQWCSGDVRT